MNIIQFLCLGIIPIISYHGGGRGEEMQQSYFTHEETEAQGG